MLEASGIFTPKAIAHFKQQSTFPEDVEADVVINGDDGLGGKKIDIHVHVHVLKGEELIQWDRN